MEVGGVKEGRNFVIRVVQKPRADQGVNKTPIMDGAQTVLLFDIVSVACKPAP